MHFCNSAAESVLLQRCIVPVACVDHHNHRAHASGRLICAFCAVLNSLNVSFETPLSGRRAIGVLKCFFIIMCRKLEMYYYYFVLLATTWILQEPYV